MGQFVLAPGAEPHHQGAEGARQEAEERRHEQRVGPVPARPATTMYSVSYYPCSEKESSDFPAGELVNLRLKL